MACTVPFVNPSVGKFDMAADDLAMQGIQLHLIDVHVVFIIMCIL